jgi:phage shock protein A
MEGHENVVKHLQSVISDIDQEIAVHKENLDRIIGRRAEIESNLAKAEERRASFQHAMDRLKTPTDHTKGGRG